MDIISIEQLQIKTIIGTYNWERACKQKLLLNIDMQVDTNTAAKDDAIGSTVDYAATSELITAYAEECQHQLIETFAEKIAALLKEKFSLAWCRIAVSKPGALANAKNVKITIER